MKVCSLLIIYSFLSLKIFASQNISDTLSLTLPKAEQLFLKNNLQLLASKYNVDEQKALVIQARLYDNPNISLEQDMYNSQTHKWFDVSSSGNSAVTVSQLITLAGKRNKRISTANLTAQMSENNLYDLIRTLKNQLRATFYDLYFLEHSISIYNKQIATLKNIISAYNNQYKKGNISMLENTRLKAELFAMENEKLELLSKISDNNSTLRLLIRDSVQSYIVPILDSTVIEKKLSENLVFEKLKTMALENRPDIKNLGLQYKSDEVNYKLQKSMNVPDLNVGFMWDRQGGYVLNYKALSLQFTLPLWNLNRGNIKAAKLKIEETKTLNTDYEDQVHEDIFKAYVDALNIDKMYSTFDKTFTSDFDKLIEGIYTNYEKKNISLLEFLDYYETYKESMVQLNQLLANRLKAFEEINFQVGKDIL